MTSNAVNVADALAHWAQQTPTANAIIEGESTISYAALDRAVWRAAAHFTAEGVRPGQVVGLMVPNSALTLASFYGLARLGATVLPLSVEQPEASCIALLQRFGATAVVGTNAPGEALPLPPDIRWFDDAPHSPDLSLRADGGGRPLKIAFSSGTTGRPKPVLRTHHMSMEIDRHRRQAVPQYASDVFVALLDMGASYGLRPCLRTLEVGATVVVAPAGIGALQFAALVRRCGATQLALTPFHAFALMAECGDATPVLGGIRELILSTANCPHEQRQRIRTRLTPNLIISYGSNEVNILAVAPPALQDRFPDCVGCCVPGIEVEAVDDNDVPLPSGAMGRLRFRAAWFPQGYMDDPEASAKSFRHGWFYPGDVGVLSPEKVINLMGRADDMVNFDGVKIAPLEVEATLQGHPAVIEAALVALPSAVHQQIPVAVVTLRQPATPEELMRFVRDRLGSRGPASVLLADALPKNAMGKVLKQELVQIILARLPK